VIAISLRPAGRRWGTVSFASTLHLSPVLDLLLADVPLRWRPEVRLGLQEALVNAAKHGNKLDPTKKVLVEFYIIEAQYWWIIADQGLGFIPSCCCTIDHTKKNVNDLDECGRGLYILHQIFDRVHWNQDGNELRLCKEFKGSSRLPLLV